MGKSKRGRQDAPPAKQPSKTLSIVADSKAVDPTLASLFASSLGPVKAPPVTQRHASAQSSENGSEASSESGVDNDEDLSEVDTDSNESESDLDSDASAEADPPTAILEHEITPPSDRKRKRNNQNEEALEDAYMQRLAKEDARDELKRQSERKAKRQRTAEIKTNGKPDGADESANEEEYSKAGSGEEDVETISEDGDDMELDVPQHETLAPSKEETELEKSSRTVFLGNVSTLAITSKTSKKILTAHLSSFIPSLKPDSSSTPHKIESFRFRSTPFSTATIPKKAAFVKKELMDATTKSTNAYVVYSTPLAAREAVKRLNGTVVLDRHLRVDGVAHPTKTDHRRCVFVGNLGFVDDESLINAAEDDDGKKKKSKPPADMEEGLWREFGKVGTVESVRVIRDPKTRVSKGFAYVQFTDPNAVEAALLYDDKKFPPTLPRKLRVTRAKHISKTASANALTKPSFSATRPGTASKKIYNPKPNPNLQSLHGRASKLLGRAGAAQLKASVREAAKAREKGPSTTAALKAPETFVFEGHRAKSGAKPTSMKASGGSGKKKGGKERTRRTARAAAWKTKAGKK